MAIKKAESDQTFEGPPTISVAPQAHVTGRPFTLDMHRKIFRIQPDFPLNASVRLVSGTNPWRYQSLGWKFYELVLRGHPESTVGELCKFGRPHGIGDMETMEHLRWLFTWGGSYVEIAGRLYSEVPEVPRKVRKRVAKAG
jgi:hypothetical protein